MKKEEKTFIITGGNSGLGRQCAKNIALKNVENHVIIASRNIEKSIQAAKELVDETGNPHIHALPLDLSSLASVRTFCETFAEKDFPPLYGLVCNAIAGSGSQIKHTVDGFEMTFGTGHWGHFLLANILLTKMRSDGRIVFVSSDQHNPPRWLLHISYTDALDLAYPKQSNRSMRYSGTKLSNIYCTYEMSVQIQAETNKNITVNAFNPGFMADTGLSGNAKSFGEKVAKNLGPLIARFLGTHSSSVLSGKWLAELMTDAQFEGLTGKYFDRGKETRSSELSYNKANAVNLWRRSIELTQLQNDETIFTI
jgi:NAD(P)-dependent dehydrogenase (short-subunit alcohol dehydrogenase family)